MLIEMQEKMQPPRILVSDPISEDALKLLSSPKIQVDYKPEISQDQIIAEIGQYDAIIVRSRTKVTRQVIDKGSRLKVIGRAGVGVDNIDTRAATERKIAVVNTPNALTNAVAEFTIGLMLELAREIRKADATMRHGKWSKSIFQGSELRGKTYGTIGIGRIGQRVAELAYVFGMRIIANDIIPIPKQLVDAYNIQVASQDQVFSEADFVDLHIPLTAETTYLVNYSKLQKMKRSSFLINTSRGKVVNENDLLRALDDKLIAGAALDVFEIEPPTRQELLSNEKIILTPHIAGQTREAQTQSGVQIVEEVLKSLL